MASAVVEGLRTVAKRQYGCDGYGYCDNSTWSSWGRWVALVVIIAAVVLIAFMLSCIQSRRRRRLGMQPMYGTGWMAKPPPYGQHNYYPNNQPFNGGAPPVYSPPVNSHQTGNTFNSNEGYYGHHGGGYGNGQENGIELQQPQSAYQPQRGGDPVYNAPEGPPPKKGDGFIR
jgi:hypothetical protein